MMYPDKTEASCYIRFNIEDEYLKSCMWRKKLFRIHVISNERFSEFPSIEELYDLIGERFSYEEEGEKKHLLASTLFSFINGDEPPYEGENCGDGYYDPVMAWDQMWALLEQCRSLELHEIEDKVNKFSQSINQVFGLSQ